MLLAMVQVTRFIFILFHFIFSLFYFLLLFTTGLAICIRALFFHPLYLELALTMNTT